MSELQVFTYASGRYLALDGRVKSVTIDGDSTKAYRTCKVEVNNAVTMRESTLVFSNGKELRVIYKGEELFRGVVFQNSIDTDANTTLVAHDFNFYLTKNADTINYKNKTANQILIELCGKFGIPTGSITGTGYVIPKFIKSGTIYELIMEALKITQEQTGSIYRIGNAGGGVTLTNVKDVRASVVLENGKNILSASRNESIEDVYTKVKLTGGDEESPVTAEASNNTGQYGTMQYYEHINDVKTAPELSAKAAAMVAEKSRHKTDLRVSGFGNTAVSSGTAIGVYDRMTGIAGTYTVEADTHTFEASGLYTMDLTLSKI